MSDGEVKIGGDDILKSLPRVLSIQSSVVHGYVGNKAAVFPLQLLGFDVDPINSVQFSNHTGYSSFTGQKVSGDDLNEILRGLAQNALLNYDYLVTGYAGSVSLLQAIARMVPLLKERNPKLLYVCDPVLGDGGRLYVPQEFVAIYRDDILPHADIALPNQTEAEFLTGVIIANCQDALRACDVFHNRNVQHVVITSIDTEDDYISVVASTKPNRNEKKAIRMSMRFPRLPGYYSGTGDLTSALIMAWFHRTESLESALAKTMSTVQAVLRRTRENGQKELSLIQSMEDILNPTDFEYAESSLLS